MFYRQLPVASPIPPSALAEALAAAKPGARDRRPDLALHLAETFGADGVRLFGSGTDALQTAFRVASGDRRAPVLIPAYTCYEVATAAVAANVRVALYDIDAATLSPDWRSIERAASHGAAAIMVAPLYGSPIDWGRARAIADEHDVPLIEDAAQAHGATFGDRPVGGLGDLSVLSFGRGKGWTGLGGGALLWRGARVDGAVAESEPAVAVPRSSEWRLVMKAVGQWMLARPAIYGIPAALPFLGLGETTYHAPQPAREMSRASAALILATREVAQAAALVRRTAAAEYAAVLGNGSSAPGEGGGALRYPVLVKGGWDAVSRLGLVELGAGRGYPTSLARLAALRGRIVNPEQAHPGADRLVAELVTLPTHALTRAEERRRAVDRIRSLHAPAAI